MHTRVRGCVCFNCMFVCVCVFAWVCVCTLIVCLCMCVCVCCVPKGRPIIICDKDDVEIEKKAFHCLKVCIQLTDTVDSNMM